MPNDLQSKVAFITGAGRGQGRAHALRMAEAGADVIAVDICAPIASNPYPMSTPAELAETKALVEQSGRRVVTAHVDVRDRPALASALAAGVGELGGLDIVVANAGILPMAMGTPDPLDFVDATTSTWSAS
jgi:NAD(P)-dependent dehydrogenase (short-subunit alcohol dehydrogenase family)